MKAFSLERLVENRMICGKACGGRGLGFAAWYGSQGAILLISKANVALAAGYL